MRSPKRSTEILYRLSGRSPPGGAGWLLLWLLLSLLPSPAAAEEKVGQDVRRALGLLQSDSPEKRNEGERKVRSMGKRVLPQVKAWIALAEAHLRRVRELFEKLGGDPADAEDPLAGARPFLSLKIAAARQKFQAGEYAQAKKLAEAVLHLDPESPELWEIRRLIRHCEERLIHREILEPTVEFRDLVCGMEETPRLVFRLHNRSRGALGVRAERGMLGTLQVVFDRRYFDGSRRGDERTITIRTAGGEDRVSLEPGGSYVREIPVEVEDPRPLRGMALRIRAFGKFQPSQWGLEERNLSRSLTLTPAECWVVSPDEKNLAESPLKKLESSLFFRDIHSFFTGGQLAAWAAEEDPLLQEKLLRTLVGSLSDLDETGVRIADVLLEDVSGVKRDRKPAGSLEITDHWQRWLADHLRRPVPSSNAASVSPR